MGVNRRKDRVYDCAACHGCTHLHKHMANSAHTARVGPSVCACVVAGCLVVHVRGPATVLTTTTLMAYVRGMLLRVAASSYHLVIAVCRLGIEIECDP
jgi:hypothetical protein